MTRAQPSEALKLLTELRDMAHALEYEGAKAYAECLLGGAAFYQGDYLATIAYSEASLTTSAQLGLTGLQSRNLNALGLARGRLSQYDQAMHFFMESLQVALDTGDEGGRARVTINMAVVHERLDEYRRAFELYREGLEIAQKQGLTMYAADALSGMIACLGALGQHRESQRLVPRALHWARTYRYKRIESTVLQFQAANLLHFGQLEEACRSAEEAVEVARGVGDKETLAEGLTTLGEAYLTLGRLSQAQASLIKAEGLSREICLYYLEARVAGLLSQLYERQGRYRQALEYARKQQTIDAALRTKLVEQRALMLSQQVNVAVMRRESELQLQRNAELARSNSVLRQTQVELTRRAAQDQLTGLANRAFFWGQAQKALAKLTEERCLGLIFADIDHLKAINDRYGHAGGDRLISELALRMRQNVRSGDLVGRLSGDEFMILLGDLSHPEDLDPIAQKLLLVLREPIEFQGQLILPTLSLGCVVAPVDGTDIETLHKHADLALYQAKAQGRNAAVHFVPDMRQEEDRRRQLEQDLRSAIREGGLELHYQGQFSLPERRLAGFEALVRWPHPELGWISPTQFVPLAEESRLILELGDWVLQEACRQAQAWQLAERGLTMAVNVSARQFEQADFVQRVCRALSAHGLSGECLMLELTESMLHHDPRAANQAVGELRAMGVHIALDDFGTGYSSLSMLKNIPFEQLKIDREFLRDLRTDAPDFAAAQRFIEVIVQFAHMLGMCVVAEGVETREQFELLCQLGCDEVQGFWLAKPLPAEQAQTLMLGEGKLGA